MQINLSPKSRGRFNRYIIQTVDDIEDRTITSQQAKTVVMATEIAANRVGQKFTLVTFETAK